MPRVAIIGGGVIGLSIAWRLAQAGSEVTLFERGTFGAGASLAAAGMLAAGLEAEPGERRLFDLCRLSQAMWPAFAAELEEASGLPVGVRTEGTLQVALTADDAARLRFTSAFQRDLGVSLEWLTPAEARRREPELGARLAGAVFCPADHQVDPRLLVPSLVAAARRAGARLVEHAEVALDCADGAVRGVCVGGQAQGADRVILCAGAWSRQVAGVPPPARPPVRPIKGQMLALQMPHERPLLRHVLWSPQVYMVPRADGRLVIGATVEERGFDASPTAGGVLALLDGAWRALPGIEELPLLQVWNGHRPGSRDDAPLLGRCGIDGLLLATGHHRNGILLTPVTADLLAHAALHDEMPEAGLPFTPGRFTPAREPA